MVNSGRQIGDPTQYYHLWWVAAAACAAAAVTSLGLTPGRQTEEENGTVARSLAVVPER